MKTSNKLSLLVSLLSVLLLGSCTSNSLSPDLPPGSIAGFVTLAGPQGGALPSSAGVTISLDGSSYTTQSDSTGFWRIDNVRAGNYDVLVSKSGFGAYRIYGVAVAGPGTAYTASFGPGNLGEAPTTAPTIQSAAIVTGMNGKQELSVITTGALFVDTDPNVQPGDVHRITWASGAGLTLITDDSSGEYRYSLDPIYGAGIAHGSTIYLSTCDVNYSSYPRNSDIVGEGTYFDPVHNQYRLISPGPRSNVVSVTLP